MTIQLTGVLPNPFGEPCPEALIRFTAEATQGGILKGVDALHDTAKDGSYDFELVEGRYLLEINYSDEYQESGSVLVDEHTPTPITLQELVLYATPYTPPLVDTNPTNWQTLFQEVIDNDEWDRQAEEQVRNEDKLVNEDKSLHKADKSYLAKETLTSSTGSASATDQSLSYEDEFGRNAAYSKTDVASSGASAKSGSEAYTDNNESSAKSFSLAEAANGGASQSQEVNGTNAQTSEQTRLGELSGDRTVTATDSTVEESSSVSNGTSEVSTKKYIDANDLVQAFLEQGVVVENVEAFDKLKVTAAGSQRDIQVDTLNVGNTFSVDTKNDIVEVRGELKLSNGDDYKGPVGDTQYLQYAYATTDEKNTNEWHIDNPDDPYDVPINSVVWRKHRTILIVDGVTTEGRWSEPYLLTGADGAEGDTLYWDYKYSATGNLGDATVITPPGWDDTLQDGHLYRIERLVNNGTYQGVWSVPAKIAGADGDNGELVFEEYMYSPYGTNTPDNDVQGHWHANFVSGDYFRSSRVIKYAAGTEIPIPAGTDPISVTAWTSPALIVPRKGFEYSDGLSQVVVYLYVRSTSAPDLPTATLTYDFDTFEVTGDLAGWSKDIPAGTGNLWITVATASSNTGLDTIAPNEWTSPQVSSTQAYNQASLNLYKRSAPGVVPSAPSATLSYDFSTGALTGNLEGWSNGTIPSGSDDLYIASATVRSQTTTSQVEPQQWGVGILTSTAFRQQTVNIYRRGSGERPASDVTYNFTDGSISGLSDWATKIPTGTEDIYIGVAVASAAGVSDVIAPADWSISPLGASGHQAVVVNLYQTGTSEPILPQEDITYDFEQGKVTSDTGAWSTSVPANTAGKMYVTTATANASARATTDVIPVSEWTTPQVILESGINSVPVTLYRKFTLEDTPPKHTNSLVYSFDNAELATAPNNNWKATPMSVGLGEAVWSVTATANGLASDSSDTIEPSEFTEPVIYAATGSVIYTDYQYAETADGPWFDEYSVERIWRIQGTSINGVIADWSNPVKMTGEDGAVGDTVYVEYNYSADLTNWHTVLEEGDIWRRERVVTNGSGGNWSSPARLKGNEQYIEYQYAVSPEVADWHTNFSTGDYYRRERSVVNGSFGAWSEGIQIVPLKDVDFSDGNSGDTIYEVYQYSVDGLTDWSYDFEDTHIYRRTAVAINGALGAWSSPAKLSGIDGAAGDTIFMEYEYSSDGINWHGGMQDGDIWRHDREHTVGVTVPSDPWSNRTRIKGYDGAYDEYLYNDDDNNAPVVPEDALGTWHSNFSEGDYYRIERLVQDGSIGDWSTPTKLKPKKGEDYDEIYYEYSYSPDQITWDMVIDSNDIWRRERRVENGSYGEWSEAIKIVGVDGTSLLVQLVSNNGFFFKNNTGAVKVIRAEVYLNSEKVEDVSDYLFHWTVGDDTVYVSATGDYVSLVPSSGLYPANGADPNGLNFSQINVDFSDVSQGSSINLLCEITEIQGN